MEADWECKFFGHWDECLRHFAEDLIARAPNNYKAAAKLREPMAEFCKVRITNVMCWFKNVHQPIGESLLRLMFFLQLVGYRVSELERMPKFQRHFAELVVFDVLSLEEARDFVGYANIKQLFPFFFGKRGVSKDKEDLIWGIWRSRKAELEDRITKARQLYSAKQEDAPPKNNGVLVPTLQQQPRLKYQESSDAVLSNEKAFIHLVRAMRELIDERLFDEYAKSEFVKQHSKVVEEVTLLLGNLSSKLLFAEQRRSDADGT